MSKPIHTVDHFGPEIMAALLRGSKESFAVSMPYREAVRFHMRLNSLRKAMRETEHEKYPVVAKTKIRIVFGKDAGFPEVPVTRNSKNTAHPVDRSTPSKVIIEPHDREFAAALEKAGITADELQGDPLADFTPEPSPLGEIPGEQDYLDQIVGPANSKKPA